MGDVASRLHAYPEEIVWLRSDQLAIGISPVHGGTIAHITHRASGTNLLAERTVTGPIGRLPSPDSQVAFLDSFRGGWQELFPNSGDECSYAGAILPFHGEVAHLPWTSRVHRTSASSRLEMHVATQRLPFVRTRSIELGHSSSRVEIADEIRNVSAEALHYLWGQHIVFGGPFISKGCRLDVPAAWVESGHVAGGDLRIPSGRVRWPDGSGDAIDLSLTLTPDARRSELMFLGGLTGGWYEVTSAYLGLVVRVEWPLDVYPYVWLWQEAGGQRGYPWFGREHFLGIEPQTSIPAHGLAACVEAGTAPGLGGGASLRSTISLTVVDYDGGRG